MMTDFGSRSGEFLFVLRTSSSSASSLAEIVWPVPVRTPRPRLLKFDEVQTPPQPSRIEAGTSLFAYFNYTLAGEGLFALSERTVRLRRRWDILTPDDALICLRDHNNLRGEVIVLRMDAFFFLWTGWQSCAYRYNNWGNLALCK